MPSIFDKSLSRRNFLKTSAVMAATAALPDMTGCASLPDRSLPKLTYRDRLIITGASYLDVRSGKIIKGKNIELRGNKITAIGSYAEINTTGAEIIDATGLCVIPGLIDAHCHTTLPSAGSFDIFSMTSYMIQLKRNHVQQIESGVTTIRDMGAMPKYLAKFREMIREGDLNGPRIIYCNAMTNIRGGHPDIDPSDISIFARPTQLLTGNQNAWFADSKELRIFLQENFESRPHFIKLTMDDLSLLCGKGKIPVYSDEHMRIIRDFAEKHDLPIAAHIHRKFGFDRALAWGINSIEHTIGDARIPDSDIARMAKKNITIVPTLTVGQVYAAEEAYPALPKKFNNDYIRQELEVRKKHIKNDLSRYIEKDIHQANVEALQYLKKYGCANLYSKKIMTPNPDLYFGILKYGPDNITRMKAAGIRIGCGTDAGVPFCYHGTLWREIETLTRTGFTAAEALRSATLVNAAIVGLGDSIGSVEPKKDADLVILRGDPLRDLSLLRDPLMVLREGRIVYVHNQKLKAVNGTVKPG